MLNRLRAWVRQRLARRLYVPEIPFALERLAKIGFRPDLIFDAGAYRGDFTHTCLEIWPDSRVACFEALENQEADLRRLVQAAPRVQVFRCLLGAEVKSDVPLHVSETGSSVLDEHSAQPLPIQLCAMRTVDEVAAKEFPGKGPDLLKLDVQGYELEILKGAESTLPKLGVILLETNLIDIYRGVPLLAEIVAWLNARDWVAYDICGLTRRPLDQALWQADFIFVPKASALRADKRWST